MVDMCEQEQSAANLAEQVQQFIRPGEQVLLCFTRQEPGSLCDSLVIALRRAGAFPVLRGQDLRWKALLRQAFFHRVTAVFGSCSAIIALAKLAAATGTPLLIRNAVLCGDTGNAQLREAIVHWLDCRIWGCNSAGNVTAFSCGAGLAEDGMGISCGLQHLRDELQTHGSVLDFRAVQTEYGLELEVVLFAGKPVPKLPTCAKRTVRTWNPEVDCPLQGNF